MFLLPDTPGAPFTYHELGAFGYWLIFSLVQENNGGGIKPTDIRPVIAKRDARSMSFNTRPGATPTMGYYELLDAIHGLFRSKMGMAHQKLAGKDSALADVLRQIVIGEQTNRGPLQGDSFQYATDSIKFVLERGDKFCNHLLTSGLLPEGHSETQKLTRALEVLRPVHERGVLASTVYDLWEVINAYKDIYQVLKYCEAGVIQPLGDNEMLLLSELSHNGAVINAFRRLCGHNSQITELPHYPDQQRRRRSINRHIA